MRLDLATGAPGLALMTGSALLPVFTVRNEGSVAIRVIVDRPIANAADMSRDDALLAMSEEFGRRMAPFVKAYPLQWRDWEKIRVDQARAAVEVVPA
jgi:lauroyl/myristoyl acyltransferase